MVVGVSRQFRYKLVCIKSFPETNKNCPRLDGWHARPREGAQGGAPVRDAFLGHAPEAQTPHSGTQKHLKINFKGTRKLRNVINKGQGSSPLLIRWWWPAGRGGGAGGGGFSNLLEFGQDGKFVY